MQISIYRDHCLYTRNIFQFHVVFKINLVFRQTRLSEPNIDIVFFCSAFLGK